MSVASTALRHSRAAGLMAVALVVAGVIAGLSLPSSIYPPLEFPRIVIIAHSGTLPSQSMMLTVTRPIEQAVMEVPGIRRVRSTQHPRRHGDLRAVRPGDRHGRRAAAGAEPRRRDPRRSAGRLRADGRAADAGGFPVFILSLTGALPTADLNDYALYVMRPALARVPGAGTIEVLASDTREIEVVLDPMKLTAAGLTVSDVADALKAQNQLQPVGRFSAVRPAAPRARLGPVDVGRATSPRRRSS